jgi:lactate dehydrogenase-like 2-hydroxyacid dehydrogenase
LETPLTFFDILHKRIRPRSLSPARSSAEKLDHREGEVRHRRPDHHLRDPIDAEVFAAGKGTLKVVAQYAVGFDNINRADANKYKVPFTNTADVLTEATAEFAFFLMGALARKLWPAEHLTRENRWGYWHPYLPFLGDEVTGKTVAVIGTGRIGLALIKKCAGFDMNILCFDPAYENHDYIKAIQETMDLRFQRGISREETSIRYTIE